jgi:hypothetical protein
MPLDSLLNHCIGNVDGPQSLRRANSLRLSEFQRIPMHRNPLFTVFLRPPG